MDEELEAHWARYMCVLASGFIENAVRTLYADYASATANPYVANYVEAQLRGFQNPSMEKILKVTGAFNTDWKIGLKNAADGEPHDAVTSIVQNRHKIAHGSSVDLTLPRVKRYFAQAVKVVECIEGYCLTPVSSTPLGTALTPMETSERAVSEAAPTVEDEPDED